MIHTDISQEFYHWCIAAVLALLLAVFAEFRAHRQVKKRDWHNIDRPGWISWRTIPFYAVMLALFFGFMAWRIWSRW